MGINTDANLFSALIRVNEVSHSSFILCVYFGRNKQTISYTELLKGSL